MGGLSEHRPALNPAPRRPHIFLNRVPFDGARGGLGRFLSMAREGALGMYGWGSRGPTRHVCSICSVVRTRDRVAGAGYACSARPDLHTVCRSFPKISSALSAKVCGGSRPAKIFIQSTFARPGPRAFSCVHVSPWVRSHGCHPPAGRARGGLSVAR
jgi:hypothetical protein